MHFVIEPIHISSISILTVLCSGDIVRKLPLSFSTTLTRYQTKSPYKVPKISTREHKIDIPNSYLTAAHTLHKNRGLSCCRSDKKLTWSSSRTTTSTFFLARSNPLCYLAIQIRVPLLISVALLLSTIELKERER